MTSIDIKKTFSLYSGKRVFVTGHTGFKGTWLVSLLKELGAETVYGIDGQRKDGKILIRMINFLMNKISVFGNFYIPDQERLEKLKISFESFYKVNIENWVINIYINNLKL